MSYASLMVHVDADGELAGRVGIAAGLADRFDAHLIGIAGWAPMSVFLADEARDNPTPASRHLQDMRSLLEQKGKEFCAAVGASGRRAEWRSVLDYPTEAVAREARRAVQDALPFLQRAESVMVVEVSEGGDGAQALQGAKDVARYLGRHHLEIVTERVRPADVTAANSLLRLIEDENIGLVVAGAYGHSRLGEWMFGGVTHDLLAESRICCLFSN